MRLCRAPAGERACRAAARGSRGTRQGARPVAWMAEVLAARSRDAAAPTFSPDGLYFLGPYYDAALGLPQRTAAFDWLPGGPA